MSRGSFPDSHPLALGMPGMHGTYTAVTAMQRADLLIALGQPLRRQGHREGERVSRRTQRSSTSTSTPRSSARSGAPRCRSPETARSSSRRCSASSTPRRGRRRVRTLSPWKAQIAEWKARFPLTYERAAPDGVLKPQYVVECLRDQSPDDTIVVSGVGQHQMWASQWWRFDHPNTWVNSGGAGTMGYAVPAAIGAKVGQTGQDRLGDRRRRMLPDDRAGARHRFRGARSR